MNSADPELEVPRELKIYRPPWMLERCSFWTFSDSTRAFVSPDTTVHGSFDLKDAKEHYALAPVPRDAVIVPPSAEVTATAPVIAASYSFPSALIAVLQFMYAVVTLIETIRGAQITTYGYAAFGLTVVPYAMMSLVNLMSALATPAYATMLMVRNEVMEEAEKRHEAQFDGVVGSLVPDPMPQMDVARVSGQASVSPPTEPSSNEKPTPEIVEESDPPSLMQFSCRHDGDATNYIYQVRQSDSRLGDMLSAPRKIAYDTSPSVFVPSCSRFRRFMFDIDTVDPSKSKHPTFLT